MKSHYVVRIEQTPEDIVAELHEVRRRLPRCGQCGRPVSVKARYGHITMEGPSPVRKLLTEATWQAVWRGAT